jgi:hypothetical protein
VTTQSDPQKRPLFGVSFGVVLGATINGITIFHCSGTCVGLPLAVSAPRRYLLKAQPLGFLENKIKISNNIPNSSGITKFILIPNFPSVTTIDLHFVDITTVRTLRQSQIKIKMEK